MILYLLKIYNYISVRIISLYEKIRNQLHKICLCIDNQHITMGGGSKTYYKSKILRTDSARIILGSNVQIGRTKRGYHGGMPFYTSLFAENGGVISIGDNCRVNGAYIHSKKKIQIGDNCVIAAGVNIFDNNGHETLSLNRTKGSDNPEEIVIGNNVWIGCGVVILKGTLIGDNCVIAANSVVKGEYPSNSIISAPKATVVKILKFPQE